MMMMMIILGSGIGPTLYIIMKNDPVSKLSK